MRWQWLVWGVSVGLASPVSGGQAAALAGPAAGATGLVSREAMEHCLGQGDETLQMACLDGLRVDGERHLGDAYAAAAQNQEAVRTGIVQHLEAGQAAWSDLREHDCAVVRDYTGLAAKALRGPLAYAWCMADHTRSRVEYVDASLRRATASAVAAARTRDVRAEAQHREAAAAPPETPHLCRYESAIATPPPERRVALTFDDGPEQGETEYIIDTLARHQIRGTFFLIGEKARQHPELVERLVQAGHLVLGNHSWTHPNFHDIAPDVQLEEVQRGDALLKDELHPKLFRYPYGNASCETNDYLHAQGYRIVGWHVDSCDWAFDLNGSVNATDARLCAVRTEDLHDYVGHVVSAVTAHRGGIVLMHEIHPHTLHHLDDLITRLEADGFSFGAVDEPAFEASLR